MSENRVRIRGSYEDGGTASALDKLRSKFEALGSSKGAQSILMGVGLGAGQMALSKITDAVGGLAQGIVGGAANMETYRTQFEVLLGSVNRAKERIADLTEFAKTTPFELPQVVEASKTLEVFTKGVLSTGDGLRLVGDVAAGTNTDINETAVWFGRLYDAMQSGKPFGEATQRLQEMGALSGESRTRLEELGKSVANGSMTMQEAWKKAAAEFSRYGGMMDKQSTTLAGKWSNLQDAVGQSLAKLGDKYLPLFKGAVDGAITAVTALGDAAILLADHVDILIPGLTILAGVLIAEVAPALVTTGLAAAKALGPISLLVLGLGEAKTKLGETFGSDKLWDKLTADSETSTKAVEKTSEAVTKFGINMVAAENEVHSARDDMVTSIVKVEETAAHAKTSIGISWGDIADRFRTAADAIVSSLSRVINDAYDPLINKAEIAAARVELANLKQERSALSVKDTEAAALDLRILQQEKALATLLAEQTQFGSDAQRTAYLNGQLMSIAHDQGWKSGDPQRIADLKSSAEAIATELGKLQGPASTWGDKTGNAWIDALVASIKSASHIKQVQDAMYYVAKRGGLVAASPPKEGPLTKIGEWGRRTGAAWIDGLAQGIGKIGPISTALGNTGSLLGGAGAPSGATAGGPIVIHSHLVVDGREIAYAVNQYNQFHRGVRTLWSE